MAASKLQANFTAVGFTPTGGSLTSITKVTGVQVGSGGELTPFAGDTDVYPTTLALFMSNPEVTVKGADIAGLQGLVNAGEGTLTWTHKDAKLATGGDIVYTLVLCTPEKFDGGGEHAQFGEGSLTFKARSTDGTTNPLTFSRS